MRGTLIVMAKAPRAGAVKTRLGRGVGTGRATAIFRHLLQGTMTQATQGAWSTVIAVDPASAITGFDSVFPSTLLRVPQGDGDLGDRMARMFRNAPPGPVVVIGADAPAMRARHLKAAFNALRGADAVFGPANDGGYWLIGLARRRAAPDLFAGVRWSTQTTLGDTVGSLPKTFNVARINMLNDIDEAEDLTSMRHRSTAR